MKSQTKIHSQWLIDQINSVVDKPQVNDLEIRRLERKAESIRHADPIGVSIVLGALSCMKKKTSSMHTHHLNAIALGGGSYAYFQYAISLRRSGLLAAALLASEKGYDADPSDTTGLHLVISNALALGLMPIAKKYINTLHKLEPGDTNDIHENLLVHEKSEVRPEIYDLVNNLLIQHQQLWKKLSSY